MFNEVRASRGVFQRAVGQSFGLVEQAPPQAAIAALDFVFGLDEISIHVVVLVAQAQPGLPHFGQQRFNLVEGVHVDVGLRHRVFCHCDLVQCFIFLEDRERSRVEAYGQLEAVFAVALDGVFVEKRGEQLIRLFRSGLAQRLFEVVVCLFGFTRAPVNDRQGSRRVERARRIFNVNRVAEGQAGILLGGVGIAVMREEKRQRLVEFVGFDVVAQPL